MASTHSYDLVIVGAGLAGSSAAACLAKTESVLLVDKHRVGTGTSSIGWGLANPIMAKQGRVVWQARQALENLDSLIRESDAGHCVDARELWRPAQSEKMARQFERTGELHTDLCTFLSAQDAEKRYPQFKSPFGGLRIRRSCAVSIPDYTRCLTALAEKRGAQLGEGFELVNIETKTTGVTATFDTIEGKKTVECKRLLLTTGPDLYMSTNLNLHRIKGQSLVLVIPDGLRSVPHVSGSGYAIFHTDKVTIGSTYNHTFDNLNPSEEGADIIFSKIAKTIPAVRSWEIVSQSAGIRVTVPGSYLPILGPLPGNKRVWIFNGLGSKGLLMSSLISHELHRFFRYPGEIPGNIRVH